MSFQGVDINKLNGGLGRHAPSDDQVTALAYPFDVSSLSKVKHYKPYRLLQLSDAEDLGINESFDANNQLLLHYHISEVFRLAPNAVLYLLPVEPTLTHAKAIVEKSEFIAAVRAVNAIRMIGIAGLTFDITDLPVQASASQTFVDNFFLEHRYIDAVIIEGKGDDTALADYPDLRTLKAPNVSVVIAQDPEIAKLDASYEKHAAVGSALGMLGVRQVNENIGSVNIKNKPDAKKAYPDYPLTDISQLRFLEATLSNGKPFSELSGGLQKELTDKGYIYAGAYDAYGGIYFSNSPTCVEKKSDYAYIENNRVWNKAARIIRQTLMPEIKGIVKKDPKTGYIKSTTIARWTALVNAGLEQMLAADETSGHDVYIDPKQFLSEDSPLKVKAQIVMDDIVHEIDVDLGLT